MGTLTYNIYRIVDGEETLAAQGVSGTTFTEQIEITTLKEYVYAVAAVNDGTPSARALSNKQVAGDGFGVPFVEHFGEGNHLEYFTVVTLKNSFHGRTLTTLAATGQDHYHELFQPLTPGFVHAAANDLEGTKALALESKAAAVMIECIQGEGGVIPLEKDYVQGLAAFCAENDILLLVDEVQTGNGRTGALYAYMNYGVTPDIVSTAKGLGGGLPLGATLFGEKTQGVLQNGDHGSTFGGNPLSCAGALSILSRIDDALLAEVREKSARVFSALEGAEGVEAVSGMGLMIGVKPVKPAGDVVRTCLENGVLCLTAKDKVRLLPALNIPAETLEKAIGILKEACK